MFSNRFSHILRKSNLFKFRSYSKSLGATTQGTKEFFKNKTRSQLQPKDQNKLGWSLSPIGIGSYSQTDFNHIEMRKVLDHAISFGINVLETSPAYLNGLYETFIGDTMCDFMSEDKIKREELIIVSKIGFITEEMKDEYQKLGIDIGPIMASLTNEIHYSLSPKYISAQIEKTLSNLKLSTIDIVLIQSPELLFPNNTEPDSLTYFYNILANCFQCLEEHVKSGKIQAYGIDSKVFTTSADPSKITENQYLSLPHLINLANTVTNHEGHHFNCISYPLNIFDSRSLPIQRIGSYENMVQLSYQITNCKIDTSDISHISGNEWIQYDLFDEEIMKKKHLSDEELIENMKNAVEPCILLEKSYEMMYKGILEKNQNEDIPHPSIFAYGQYIITNASRIDYHDYKTSLFPSIKMSIDNELKKLTEKNEELKEWASKFSVSYKFLHEKFLAILEENRRKDMKELSDALDECCEELKQNMDLASKCIRIVLSSDTSTALVEYSKPSQILRTFLGEGNNVAIPSLKPLDKEVIPKLFQVGKDQSKKIKDFIIHQHQLEVESMNRR